MKTARRSSFPALAPAFRRIALAFEHEQASQVPLPRLSMRVAAALLFAIPSPVIYAQTNAAAPASNSPCPVDTHQPAGKLKGTITD